MLGEVSGGKDVVETRLEGVILDVTPGSAAFEEHFLESLGHPVLVCHGPEHRSCPLLDGEECELLEQAHGVVFQLDLDRPQHRFILDSYRAALGGDRPIGVLVRPGQEVRHAELLAVCRVWTQAPTAADLDGFAAQVEAADRFGERQA